MVKFGVMTFGYGASPSQRQKFEKNGFISINLGDFMQTLAARQAYSALGIAASDVIDIDRDSLATYDGEPVKLVMNGCFFDWNFPLSPAIQPIFLGFQARRDVIQKHLAVLKQYEPIGCRDAATAAELARVGVQAFVFGCLTLTFAQRTETPDKAKTFVVYGDGAGAFPNEVLRHMPGDRLATVEFVHQRKLMHEFPLSESGRCHAEDHARTLLHDYRARATLVVTSLHHAAAPCASMGIPVVICRQQDNARFSTIRHLMPYFAAEGFDKIDWNGPAIDFTQHRETSLATLAQALSI